MSDLNKSGQRPIEYKVIVKIEKIEKKTAGGIILPETLEDKLNFAQSKGILVALGGKAFEDFPEKDKPKIGDKVYFKSYSGIKIDEEETFDKQTYRILLDKEIISIYQQQ